MQRPASRSFLRNASAAALAVAALAALSGCVVAPLPPARGGYVDHGYINNGPVYDSYGGGGVVVDVAPPAPRYEVITPAPALGWLWIAGYWGWRNNAHYWVGGHWEAPRAGYRYVPHSWEPTGRGGYRERPGYWRDAR